MSDEQVSPTAPVAGQEGAAPWAQGQAEPSPAPQGGQADAPHGQDAGQAPTGTPPTDEPGFFDPNQVPPELLPAYKQMQAAFTVKTQDIARHRQKIEAYDAFMRDPVGQIQQLASQYGLNLTRREAQQVQQQTQQGQAQQWEPQTWDEVMSEAERRAEERIMQRLAPYLGQVQEMQAKGIESQLNQIDKQWRTYENAMRQLLQHHPTLVNDVSTLYRMAVPPEVLEAKAIQEALKKFEDKAKHSAVTPGGPAPKSKPGSPTVKSFEDAVKAAREQLARGE